MSWSEMYGDEHLRMTRQILEQQQKIGHLQAQIKKLADVILQIPGEPSADGGAIDAAIRLILDREQLREEVSRLRTGMERIQFRQLDRVLWHTREANREMAALLRVLVDTDAAKTASSLEEETE